MSNLPQDALNALNQVHVDPSGRVSATVSIGGQAADLPTPVKLSAGQVQTLQAVQDAAAVLHPLVNGGHVTPQSAMLSLAYAITHWFKF